jgi:hypothetical protein
MAGILQVLAEHSRMLERLPEAVREKIGFKGQLRQSGNPFCRLFVAVTGSQRFRK